MYYLEKELYERAYYHYYEAYKNFQITKHEFFSGKMTQEKAYDFLKKELIDYIFFGPQERELGSVRDLEEKYKFLTVVYSNNQVVIYKY